MGWPVVVVSSGGIPVTEADNGLGTPVDIAANGFGTAVTVVSTGGLPVIGANPNPVLPSSRQIGIVVNGSDDVQRTTFNSWFGKTAQVINMVLPDTSTWSNLATVTAPFWGTTYAGQAGPWLWTFPGLLSGDNGTVFASYAAGGNNANYTTLFQAILAASPNDGSLIYIRPMHEANYPKGTWPWAYGGVSANDPVYVANYIGTYRQIVKCGRAVSSRFRFSYCIALNPRDASPLYNPWDAYPGTAYVDVIDLDLYWMVSQGGLSEFATAAAAWTELTTMPYGINDVITFANARGRKVALSELGIDFNQAGFYSQLASLVASGPFVWACLFDLNLTPFNDRLSDQDYKLWDAGDDFVNSFGTAHRGARKNANTDPTIAAGSWFTSANVTWAAGGHANRAVLAAGASDFGGRSYDGSAIPVAAGNYELQFAYALVPSSTHAFFGVFFSGSSQNEFLYISAGAVQTKSANIGTPVITATLNTTLVSIPITVLPGATGFTPTAGPGNGGTPGVTPIVVGDALDVFGMRLRAVF